MARVTSEMQDDADKIAKGLRQTARTVELIEADRKHLC